MSTPTSLTLSLAESFALLEEARADAHEIVFLAMVELVARGGARLVAVPGGDPDELAFSLTDRSNDRGPVGAMAGLLAGCSTAPASNGAVYIPTSSAASAFERKWHFADRFVRREVWPALVARGLVTTEPNVLDAVFVVDAWHLTPEGQAEQQRLRDELAGQPDWKAAPATALLVVLALPVPSDETFDALDELEDLITPGDQQGSDGSSPLW